MRKLLVALAVIIGAIAHFANTADAATVRNCGDTRYFVNITTRKENCHEARTVARVWGQRYTSGAVVRFVGYTCRARHVSIGLDVRCTAGNSGYVIRWQMPIEGDE